MYEIDGVCYAGKADGAEGKRIIRAVPLAGQMMLLRYASGEERLFDATLLEGPAFEPLKDATAFNSVKVEHGFVSWAGGEIDVAPEYIYEHSVPYNRQPDWALAG